MIASLVVKVIGAFFQIPLQNLIGGETRLRSDCSVRLTASIRRCW